MVFSGSTGQKASGEGIFKGDSESWNVADGFTKINVLKILIEINMYEEIARFGFRQGEDCIETEIPYKRVEGFERLMFALRQVTSNCMFQIEKDDRKNAEELIKRVDQVESFSSGICDVVKNDVTKESILRINEEHFRKCLDILSDVKQDLNSILNRAGLIFRKGEETDLDDFLKSVYEG